MAHAPGNVADLVARASAKVPRRTALVDGSASLSLGWQQCHAAVDRYARVLLAAGTAPGDRVALRLPNTIEYCVALFAILRVGAVAVPLPLDAAPREVERVLDHSGATLAVGEVAV
ncbi:MAG: acyl--CoA ligase, partial [Actinomycetota bacterium]|nr:acyl--CoA ligase [Actinomycetota bacterium]